MTKKVSPKTCRRDRCGRRCNAFTLIELIVVVGIIIVLSGLVLSTVGYARKKGARARAETEIAAMSAACENYKADNGVYPRDNPTPDTLRCIRPAADPRRSGSKAFIRTPVYICITQLSGLNRESDADYRRNEVISRLNHIMLSIDTNRQRVRY